MASAAPFATRRRAAADRPAAARCSARPRSASAGLLLWAVGDPVFAGAFLAGPGRRRRRSSLLRRPAAPPPSRCSRRPTTRPCSAPRSTARRAAVALALTDGEGGLVCAEPDLGAAGSAPPPLRPSSRSMATGRRSLAAIRAAHRDRQAPVPPLALAGTVRFAARSPAGRRPSALAAAARRGGRPRRRGPAADRRRGRPAAWARPG